MTSPTSSSETDLQAEIDALKARILVLEGLVTGLQAWQWQVPFGHAAVAGACQPPAPVIYPGSYPYTVTVPYMPNVCQGAAGVPLTYIVDVPSTAG